MKIFVMLAAMVSFYSTASFATYYGCDSKYYVVANYSGVAYGKSVKSVKVHAGVSEKEIDGHYGSSRYFWEPTTIADVEMSQVTGHFFVKFTTAGHRGGGAGPISVQNLGPVIQYWVTFTDGSTLVSDIAAIPVLLSFGPSSAAKASEAISKYGSASDSPTTASFETHGGMGCSN